MSSARLGDRGLFPDLEWKAFLNHCAIAPPPAPVQQALRTIAADYGRRGVGVFGDWMQQRERLRSDLGRLIGCEGSRIAFLPNTTSGVTAVAMGFPWKAGDRVVLLRGEFPANVTPWLRAAQLFSLEPLWQDVSEYLRDPEDALDGLEALLRRGVRLVAVSAVQFQNGYRMPLERLGGLCDRYGARLFVDGIQACGIVPLRAAEWGVHYLAGGSHKWLMAMEGAGFLYVGCSDLVPRLAGWLSYVSPLEFLKEGAGHMDYLRPFQPPPGFLEGSSLNALGYAALGASVQLLLELGVEAVYHHVQVYLDALESGLLALGFTSLRRSHGRSGILGVLCPPGVDLKLLVDALAARGVSCSMPDGVLRFGPSWPNGLAEVDVVLAACADALATTLSRP